MTQLLWRTGLVALRPVESSYTRNQTGVPCTARWILNHWTTRGVPYLYFKKNFTYLIVYFWLYHMAYGILVPQPGIEAVLWAVKGQAPKD